MAPDVQPSVFQSDVNGPQGFPSKTETPLSIMNNSVVDFICVLLGLSH